jgi:D-alanyl-D-alanine carboxypeptidase
VAPGAFHYSDGNYMLLGSIITAVTASTVKQELERRVFQPLGLQDTVWPTTPTVPRLARGYFGRGDVTSMPPSILTPASGLVSTAPNVRTFLRALLRGRLLASSELEAMKTYGPPAVGESYDAYGLGLMYVSSPCPVWGHRGRFGGYTSFALADGSGRRIVVLLVNSGGIGEVARAAVTRLVATTVCS